MVGRLFARAVTVCAIAVLLAGCASEEFLTWEPETAAERDLRIKAEKLQATKGEGALSGALVGALIGLATGDVRGVAAGARLGRLAGAGAGLYIKSLQADYADQEAQLERVRLDIQESIDELTETLETMRLVLDEQSRILARLRANKNVTSRRLSRQKVRAEGNLAEMRRAVAAAERREAIFSETRDILVAGDDTAKARAISEEKVDPYLNVLQSRVRAMREVAEALANEV